jgi:SAM-dependent methyltransferase
MFDLLHRLRATLERGADIPLVGVRVGIRVERRDGATKPGHEVFRNTLRRLVELFPELQRFAHPATDSDARACLAALDAAYDYLPLIFEGARETQLRRILTRLRDRVTDADYRRQLTLEIARSDVRSGVPERATVLLRESREEDRDLLRRLQADIELFERRYGARAGLIPAQDVWSGIPGDVRGQSLIAYFEAHPDQVRRKRILHVAPEETLRQWLDRRARALEADYVTLDPFLRSVDATEDLTKLSFDDASFDLVICHRVLEHVLDDGAALREMRRVLRSGGTLNLSVPQSANRDTTNEWVVPDESHDRHVRQYGMDLEQRVRAAGFAEVTVERFLLERTREQHVADRTYPLRMYICKKS